MLKKGSIGINKTYLGLIESKKSYLGSNIVFDNTEQGNFFLRFDQSYIDYVYGDSLDGYTVDSSVNPYEFKIKLDLLNTRSDTATYYWDGGDAFQFRVLVSGDMRIYRGAGKGFFTISNFRETYRNEGVIEIKINAFNGTNTVYVNDVEIYQETSANDFIHTFGTGLYLATTNGTTTDSIDIYSIYFDNGVELVEFNLNEGSGNTVKSVGNSYSLNVFTSNPLGQTYIDDTMWQLYSLPSDGDIYLMIGQSNMDGRGGLGGASPQYLGVIPNSKIWNGSSWEDLEAGVNGGSTGQFGLIFSMAYELQNLNPTKTNYFVFVAQGGTGFSNDEWNEGDPLYNQSVTDFNTAFATGNYEKKAICWQQGERDSTNTTDANNYELAEGNMIDAMKVDTGFSVFIDGKLPNITAIGYDFYSTVNTAKDDNLTANKSDYTIDTSDLSLQGDGLHFPSSSYETLGIRYFDIVKNL